MRATGGCFGHGLALSQDMARADAADGCFGHGLAQSQDTARADVSRSSA